MKNPSENPGQYLFFNQRSIWYPSSCLAMTTWCKKQRYVINSFQNKLHCWLRIPDWYVPSPKHRSQTNSPPIIHDWKIISSYLIINYNTRLSFHYFLLVSVIIPHYPHDIPTVFPYMSGPEKPSPSRLQTPPNPPNPPVEARLRYPQTDSGQAASHRGASSLSKSFRATRNSHYPLRLGCLGG